MASRCIARLNAGDLPNRQLKICTRVLKALAKSDLPYRQLKIKTIVSTFMLIQQTAG